MQSEVTIVATERESAEPPKYEKRIGSTVFRVTVHFSKKSSDTLEDKLIRLMESEVRENA